MTSQERTLPPSMVAEHGFATTPSRARHPTRLSRAVASATSASAKDLYAITESTWLRNPCAFSKPQVQR